VSLAAWFASAQLVDLIWPVCLLLGLEHVRIAPGITAFTPLDFYHYPITHSLIGGLAWAGISSGLWLLGHRRGPVVVPDAGRAAGLLALGVLSHWVLDVISHRPDVPVLPGGPYLGLGLWYSVPATLVVEIGLFAGGLLLYVRSGAAGAKRVSFWLLVVVLLASYAGAAFGPPPPDVRTLAVSALLMWLFVPWAWWADR
jgi:hypothetical protein